jgi:lysyl-tRNA synthetase class 2
LGNGYWELADADELAARFRADQAKRSAQDKPIPGIDAAFIAAHRAGLPDCAGIAVGVDRVLMARLGVAQIDRVISFGVE